MAGSDENTLVSLAGLLENNELLKTYIESQFYSYYDLLSDAYDVYGQRTENLDGTTTLDEEIKDGATVKATYTGTISADGNSLTETTTIKGIGPNGGDVTKTRSWTIDEETGEISGVITND